MTFPLDEIEAIRGRMRISNIQAKLELHEIEIAAPGKEIFGREDSFASLSLVAIYDCCRTWVQAADVLVESRRRTFEMAVQVH